MVNKKIVKKNYVVFAHLYDGVDIADHTAEPNWMKFMGTLDISYAKIIMKFLPKLVNKINCKRNIR